MKATLMLTFGGYTGYGYLVVAMVLGLFWLYLMWSGFKAKDDKRWARQLFVFSFMNISELSDMMSIDYTLPLNAALKWCLQSALLRPGQLHASSQFSD